MTKPKETAIGETSVQATDATQVQLVSEKSLYASTKAIEAAIAEASTKGNELQLEYHKIACSVIVHLGRNFDIRVFNRLIDTMPESLRKDSMQAFFDKYSVVAFDDEGNASIDKTKGTRLGDALANAWWKAKKATPYIPYNFLTKCKEMLAVAQKRAKKAEQAKIQGKPVQETDDVTWEQVNAFSMFIQTLEKKEDKATDPLADISSIAA